MRPRSAHRPDSSLRAAIGVRRSYPRVTEEAPTRAELVELLTYAATVPDHGALRPWRVVELRGEARHRLGEALAAAAGRSGAEAERMIAKPLRAPLLLGVIAVTRPSPKVAEWEQEVTAAGVAHLLALLLDDAGWGVMWRTGPFVRSDEVARLHGLLAGERLLGWLYVGGVPVDAPQVRRPAIDVEALLTAL